MNIFQENGEVKTFTGNSNTNTVKKNALPAELYTKAVRFLPKSYSGGGIALRVELYGYPAGMNSVMLSESYLYLMPWNTRYVNSSWLYVFIKYIVTLVSYSFISCVARQPN